MFMILQTFDVDLIFLSGMSESEDGCGGNGGMSPAIQGDGGQ